MFFHTGLITEADEPNMIIGVIAHESVILPAGIYRA